MRSDYILGRIQLIFWIPINLQNFWKCHHVGRLCSVVSCTLCPHEPHYTVNSKNTHKIFIQCLDVYVCLGMYVFLSGEKSTENLIYMFGFILFFPYNTL